MAKRKEELQELRGLTVKQLYDRINDSRNKLTLLSQDKLLGKIKNPKEIGALRRSIARSQTILDEKVSAQVSEK